MNEKVTDGNSISEYTQNPIEVIEKVYSNAMKTRGEYPITYRPYKKSNYVKFSSPLGWACINLDEIYPDADKGDFAYVDFCISCVQDGALHLNVAGRIAVFYNGECIYDVTANDDVSPFSHHDHLEHLPIGVTKGKENSVRIKCVKGNEPFKCGVMITTEKYHHMWANDYLFNARAVLPTNRKEYEEGFAISPLFKNGSEVEFDFGRNDYALPKFEDYGNTFDFEKLCGKGDVCYVYTEAADNCVLEYEGEIDKVFVNGKEQTKEKDINKGDKILLRVPKTENGWGIHLNTNKLSLPWLSNSREKDINAMYIGPFYGNMSHAPEFLWDLSKVFENENGERLYWRFSDNSQLRIYIDSAFFGQWFYALMVGFYGIRVSSEITHNEEGYKMFCRDMQFLAKYFDYIKYDIATNTMPAFMPRISEMNVLDNIGTMGMNLVDGYLLTNDEKILPIVNEIARIMDNDITCFDDGVYHRVDTMWADDLFMSCPFLVRMGRLTGDNVWYDKAAKQILGFAKRMYMEDRKLFSHIYFPNEKTPNRVPWGRGNGWVMWTMSEYLLYADKNSENYEAVLKLFQNMSDGIRACQHESGLWRQVLDRYSEDSFIETSCTAMFLLAFTRGVKNGWLDESFIASADAAWSGLTKHSIDKNGDIYGVCMGSGCSMDGGYYCTLNTIVNDDHGTGIVLAAAAEYSQISKGDFAL